MATAISDEIFGRCRCCLKMGHHRDITKCYYRNGVPEVYRDIILDCFNLILSKSLNLTTLICSTCIRKLTEASSFKVMVVESEQWLLGEIGKNSTEFVNVSEAPESPETTETPETSLTSELHIKPEPPEIKEEPQDGLSDCDDAADYEVPFENHNKYVSPHDASQGGKGDLVEGEAALLARFPQGTPRLPTRDTLHAICPRFARHLDLLRGKVILPKMIERMLDAEFSTMTDHDRKSLYSEKIALVANSALLLENSNVTPFKSRNRTGFPCFYCRHSFETLIKIKEHQARSHNKKELRELLRTSGPESFVVYVDTTDLKCTICNQNMKNINDLKLHLTKIHKKTYHSGCTDRIIPFKLSENNIYECQICGFSLETFGSIERHMNTHYRNYVCKDCGAGFVTKYRLKVHMKSMHVDGALPCELCKKVFASHQRLKNHIDTVHKLIKRFKCPKCLERFSEYFKRQKHMVEKHGMAPLQYKCNVCDKSFDRRYTLSRHMKRDHLEERDFQCETCAYKCFTRNELRVHMIKHNGARIYECSVCKKSYARKKTLREHLRIHNNDRRFSCAVCGQAFVQKCSLKGHMKTHHMEYSV